MSRSRSAVESRLDSRAGRGANVRAQSQTGRPVRATTSPGEQALRQGLFISRCQGALTQALDVDALAACYTGLDVVRTFDDFYDLEAFETLLNEVQANRLSSVVLAGDSPLAYRQIRNGEQIFACLEALGVARSRVEVVNLRNMVVRPHRASPEAIFEKARLLIDVGLAKTSRSHVVTEVEVSPRKAVAILGASPGGFAAAQHLLDQGYKVYLADNRPQGALLEADSPHVRTTLSYLARHPRFLAIPDNRVTDFFGFPGDYQLTLSNGSGDQVLQVGAIILSPTSSAQWLKELRQVFRIDLDESGKLTPRDEVGARCQTLERGVFVINPGPGMDRLAEELHAADAAAAQVINLLSTHEIYHSVLVSEVDTDLCGGCGVCVKTCMFHAVSLVGSPPVSVIDPRRCRSCGNCVTACPAGARDLIVCPTSYLFSAVEILSRFTGAGSSPRVLALGCDGCGYGCLDRAADQGQSWPIGVLPLWVVCGGQIDTQLVMHALVCGFDGVLLLTCGEGCCHNLVGNVDLERRINLLREILASRGIDAERVQVVSTCSRKGADCVVRINSFYQRLQTRVGSFAGAADR